MSDSNVLSSRANLPYYEVQLIASLANPDQLWFLPLEELPSDHALAQAVRDHRFAEVNIPHLTPEASYCYTVHLVGVPNCVPAVMEMMLLKNMVSEIHENLQAYNRKVQNE